MEYVGDDTEDGLKCHKVHCEFKSSGTSTPTTNMRIIWICPDRNYLPIRTEFYPGGWMGKYHRQKSAGWTVSANSPEVSGFQ